MKSLKLPILIGLFTLLLSACGASSSSDNTEPTDSAPDTTNPVEPDPVEPDPTSTAPQNLIGNAFSGTSIGLAWLDSGETYTVYRDNVQIAQTSEPFFID